MDVWHWGTVSPASFALICEVSYGFLRHSGRVWNKLYPQGRACDDIPLLDRLFVRLGELVDIFAGPNNEPIEQFAAHRRFRERMAVHAFLLRGVGRFTLAAVLIAAFAARALEFRWVSPAG